MIDEFMAACTAQPPSSPPPSPPVSLLALSVAKPCLSWSFAASSQCTFLALTSWLRHLPISGEDGTQLGFLAQGGHGCISVTANVAPKLCSEMHSAWQEKNISKAQEINLKLSSLHSALFSESSPGPVKYAASLLGLCYEDTRLPLSKIKENTKKLVKNCLKELQLL